MVVTIKKQQYYLWRAVDSDGNVLEVLLQRHRDIEAAERFFRKLLKKQGFVPQVMVTDKLKRDEAAKKQMMKRVKHRQHQGLNHRAENSHQPPESEKDECDDSSLLDKPNASFSAFDPIRGHFHPKQPELSAKRYREQLQQRFEAW